MPDRRDWHLDKKTTIAVMVTLAMNAGSMIWSVSSLYGQVSHQQKQIEAHAVQIQNLYTVQSGIAERLAKLEVGQQYQTKVLDRIEGRLSK